jgi:hypothetical protein
LREGGGGLDFAAPWARGRPVSRGRDEPAPEQGFSRSRPPTLSAHLRVVSAVDPLRDELLRPPAEGWRPSPGDVLIGEITAIEERAASPSAPTRS